MNESNLSEAGQPQGGPGKGLVRQALQSMFFNRIKLFIGPIGSGKSQEVNRLADGRKTIRVDLTGLHKDTVERLLQTLLMPIETELVVLENASPRHIQELVWWAVLTARSEHNAWLPHVVITTSSNQYIPNDLAMLRRVSAYFFPRNSNDIEIRLNKAQVTTDDRLWDVED